MKSTRSQTKYTKPRIIAKNSKQGVYAATCPADYSGTQGSCKRCFTIE